MPAVRALERRALADRPHARRFRIGRRPACRPTAPGDCAGTKGTERVAGFSCLKEIPPTENRWVAVRDDFSAKTLRLLAARAGNHCSNPGCVRSTSGPAVDPDRSINVGVGAHIAAASRGGKRHDASMTAAERRSTSNGIWLCQTCAKLIDSDENRYTVALLRKWKKDAERRAIDAIASGRPLGPVKPSAETRRRGRGIPARARSAERGRGGRRGGCACGAADKRISRRSGRIREGPARTIALTPQARGGRAVET